MMKRDAVDRQDISNMQSLQNKRVLITGAGCGLGREMARCFAAAGAHVIVTDRDPERVARTADWLLATGAEASGYPLDITDRAALESVHAQVHAHGGPIDVLVNNAGVVFGGAFLDVAVEDHLATLRVNFAGMLLTSQTFLPDLIARPEAHLVNIVSASALVGLPFATTYAASKWATLGFTESLREELRLLGHRHVLVTDVSPTYIATGMFDGAKPVRFSKMLTPEGVARQVLQAVQQGREHVRTPWPVKITPALKAFLPRPCVRWLNDFFGVSRGLAAWQGRGRQGSDNQRPG
jgi:all-trans-retinol dehydrogenase (NAD+)